SSSSSESDCNDFGKTVFIRSLDATGKMEEDEEEQHVTTKIHGLCPIRSTEGYLVVTLIYLDLLVVVPLAIDPVIDTRVEEGAEVERGEGNGVGRGIGVLRLAIDTEGEVDRRVEIGEEAGVRAG
ncbi:hypothetical protein PENTCL1PPCAC_1135, partial [Pristionchus entomophagus]